MKLPFLLLLALLPGVAFSRGFEVGAPPPGEAGIRAQAARRFASAWLIKPPEHGDTNSLAWRLAPILILEAATNRAPGGLTNPALRTVFYAERNVVIAGRDYRQVAYFWRPATNLSDAPSRVQPRGIMLTVDSDGWPVLSELLGSIGPSQVFFATQRLERAAAREFGAPLRGRQFALERSLRTAPRSILGLVIEDGPMPMGPMVYLTADQQTITAVLCRCMPSPIESAAGGANYELKRVEWTAEFTAGRRAPEECLRMPGTRPSLEDELDSLEPGGIRQ